MSYRIDVIASLEDNYIYAITQDDKCILVDPGSYADLVGYLTKKNFKQVDVLLTHSHWDHVEAIPELYQAFPNMHVYATQATWDEIHFRDGRTVPNSVLLPIVADKGLRVQGLEFLVLNTPGHAKNCVTYILDSCMFVGDTLYAAGCGRVLEGGDLVDLYISLDKLKSYALSLPKEKLEKLVFFPAHEYTLANIQFCRALNDVSLPAKLDVVEQLAREALANNAGYTPVSFASELAYNPFLRAGSPENFAVLRTFKDNFKDLHNAAEALKEVNRRLAAQKAQQQAAGNDAAKLANKAEAETAPKAETQASTVDKAAIKKARKNKKRR